MKKKVLLMTLALALMIQSSVMAEATHRHIWEDDIKTQMKPLTGTPVSAVQPKTK